MEVTELAPGLWRWTGYHEEWKQDVGCVYLETPDAIVLIDPLIPSEDEARFLAALDRDVKRERKPVHVVITIFWHARSAATSRERYGARLWAPSGGRAAVQRAPRPSPTPSGPATPAGRHPGVRVGSQRPSTSSGSRPSRPRTGRQHPRRRRGRRAALSRSRGSRERDVTRRCARRCGPCSSCRSSGSSSRTASRCSQEAAPRSHGRFSAPSAA